jgi:anti-sigma B factor antagonist
MSSSDHNAAVDYTLSTQADGAVILQFRGDLDFTTVAWVEAALRQATREPPPLLVLDLRPVTFLDSAGVLLLLQAYRGQKAVHKDLRIVVDPGQAAYRVLALSGLIALPGIEWEPATDNEPLCRS